MGCCSSKGADGPLNPPRPVERLCKQRANASVAAAADAAVVPRAAGSSTRDLTAAAPLATASPATEAAAADPPVGSSPDDTSAFDRAARESDARDRADRRRAARDYASRNRAASDCGAVEVSALVPSSDDTSAFDRALREIAARDRADRRRAARYRAAAEVSPADPQTAEGFTIIPLADGPPPADSSTSDHAARHRAARDRADRHRAARYRAAAEVPTVAPRDRGMTPAGASDVDDQARDQAQRGRCALHRAGDDTEAVLYESPEVFALRVANNKVRRAGADTEAAAYEAHNFALRVAAEQFNQAAKDARDRRAARKAARTVHFSDDGPHYMPNFNACHTTRLRGSACGYLAAASREANSVNEAPCAYDFMNLWPELHEANARNPHSPLIRKVAPCMNLQNQGVCHGGACATLAAASRSARSQDDAPCAIEFLMKKTGVVSSPLSLEPSKPILRVTSHNDEEMQALTRGSKKTNGGHADAMIRLMLTRSPGGSPYISPIASGEEY